MKWALGVSLFLTLEEAKEDALKRWQEHHTHSQRVAELAKQGLDRVLQGDLQVHPVTENIAKYHAFP